MSKLEKTKSSSSQLNIMANATACYSYERTQAIATFLAGKTTIKPKLGIVCGSGLSGIAGHLENSQIIKYEDIPDFPQITVAGHEGSLVFGLLGPAPVVVMKGRFHTYEGHPAWKSALAIRVMRLLGAEYLLVTNAAGGLNAKFNIGDIMIIRDHISLPALTGESPLRGLNDERWGPRFPPLNGAYNPEMIKLFEDCAVRLKLNNELHKGVYVMAAGPAYETVAECRALKTLGADAVGMSTTHEVTMAAHCGLRTLGLSLITNKAVMDWDSKVTANHQEVLDVAKKRAKDIETLVVEFVSALFPGKKTKSKI